MNKAEAKNLLAQHLAAWRDRPYADLVAMIQDCENHEVVGPFGARYQVEIQAFWDDKSKGHVRLCAAIDDGGIHAFFPLTDDFIMAADGSFVGE